MALATKCPQCGALFRVVADQLKLRGGLVRCGQCRAVFDAIGSLTYLDDAALSQAKPESPPRPAPVAPAADEPASPRGPSTTLRIAPIAPATLAGHPSLRLELPKSTTEEPAAARPRAPEPAPAADPEAREAKEAVAENRAADQQVPTLIREHSDHVADEAAPAIEVVEAAPAPETVAEERPHADSAPSFVRRKRRKPRGFSIVFSGGSLLLALIAAAQLAVIFRTEVMIQWPQSRPLLSELCRVFGCTVNWPAQADQLAVIGTELQSIPGTDALELTAVVRNRAGFRQSLPAVEVTLTDARNRALARKVFTPADYLASAGEPTARLQEGLAPGADFTIRIFFEARGVNAAGFLVYPFYL